MASTVSSGCTELKSVRSTYNWTIENCNLLRSQSGYGFSSDTFGPKDKSIQWCLLLYPQGCGYNCSNSICLSLSMKSSRVAMSSVSANCHFSIIKWDTVLAEGKFESNINIITNGTSHRVIAKDTLLQQCQPENCFIIRCELDYLLAMVKKPAKREIVYNVKSHHLGEDCRHLRKDSNQFSDVTIVVGETNIPAHKFLLAARSPVFAAMFTHEDFEENKTNEIKIEDLEADVIEGMLDFIYTDQVMNLSDLADRLIVAAQKYELQGLRTMCEKSLYQCLNIANAGDIVVLADLHGSNEFLVHVIEFIADNFSEVIATSAYDRIEDHELLKKLTRAADCRLH